MARRLGSVPCTAAAAPCHQVQAATPPPTALTAALWCAVSQCWMYIYLDFLREVEEVAGDQSSADLYHWSAMEFGEHWLQRLSLVLARGQGDLVLEAVKTARKNHRGRDGGRGASAEWSQTDCQPCVSLA